MSERLRREKGRKKERVLSALERLKKVRSGEADVRDGIRDEEDVYQMVDEDEYSELVNKRQTDNWIVNDAGETGYYEDGREIFDDQEEEQEDEQDVYDDYATGQKRKKKKVPLKKQEKPVDKKISSIKNFMQPGRPHLVKKQSQAIEINDEDLLNGILNEINSSSSKDQSFTSKLTRQESTKRKYCTIASTSSTNPFAVDEQPTKRVCKQEDNLSDDDEDQLLDANELDIKPIIKQEPQVNELEVTLDDMKDFDFDEDMQEDDHESVASENIQLSFDVNSTKNSSKYVVGDLAELEQLIKFTEDEEGNKFVNFYWLDIYEDPKKPGTLYLVGKLYLETLSKYVSCCFIANNIEKKVYVYPRSFHLSDPDKVVTMQNVYDELKERFLEFNIKSFRSKPVSKLYSFEKEIATSSEYLEVLFDANRTIPQDLSGETFKCVFGTSQTSLERFLLEIKLRGPCWIKVKNPEVNFPQITWCKAEFLIKSPFSQFKIQPDDFDCPPPLTLMTISLKTYRNAATKQNEILSISCLCNSEFRIESLEAGPKVDMHFCLITKPSSSQIIFPHDFTNERIAQSYKRTRVEVCGSERELLNLFLVKIMQIDPDIFVGHDINGYDFETILNRLAHFKIANWSKISRIKTAGQIPLRSKERFQANAGRLLCDVMISSSELIKSKSYDLTELTHQVLKKSRIEFDQALLPKIYSSSRDLLSFVDRSIIDADHVLNIMLELNILPLALQITKIAGNLMARTLLGGRNERNEYLLLHSFYENGYIVPDKVQRQFQSKNEHTELGEQANFAKRKKAAYAGGLVLDPKVGFYDKFILLMDFNSLYPSIIQEYNICFTTVGRKSYLRCLKEDTGDILPDLPNKDQATGILPVEIARLVTSRREVKKLLCSNELKPNQRMQLDIKQKALKLTANSMYGCLGFSNSRFYAKPLAALITSKGRTILGDTKQLAESLGLDVIYGDTDSIMINTNSNDYDEARKIGTKLQSEINRHYKLLEIEIDGLFRSILLLKKKKYAALTVTKVNNQLKYETEVKGLDIVRRDWSNIARKVGEHVLGEILSINKPAQQILDNIHNFLKETAESIRQKQVPLNLFVITKQLTKNPEDYNNSKSLPHVLVALRRNESTNLSRKYKQGDTIPYVVCVNTENPDNFNSLPATQRAFHVEELKENADLEIDSKYYLSSQIHPIVSRLVDPIDGTNTHVIAEFLGIEAPRNSTSSKHEALDYELLFKADETRYDTCKPLLFKCPQCANEIQLRSSMKKVQNVDNEENVSTNTEKASHIFTLNFSRCEKCNIDLTSPLYYDNFENQLRLYIRSIVNEFYTSWMTCEDPTCKYRTRNFAGSMTKKGVICPECRQSLLFPDMTDAQLHLQLSFFIHIFSLENEIIKLRHVNFQEMTSLQQQATSLIPLFKKLTGVVEQYKSSMAYDEVDLAYLFHNQYFSFLKTV